MQNYDNFYPSENEYFLESGQATLNDMLAGHEGKTVEIDDVSVKVVLQIHTNPLSKRDDNFKIITTTDTDINKGSLVKFNNEFYLVLTKPQVNDIYKYANIEFCNQTLTWVDEKGNIRSYPCVARTFGTGIDTAENPVLPVTDRVIDVNLQNNDNLKLLKNGRRFMLVYGETYEMVNHGSAITPEIMNISLKQDMFNSETDKRVTVGSIEYLIADYVNHNSDTGYTTQLSPDVKGLRKGTTLEVRSDRLNNGDTESTDFTFSIHSSTTANPSDYVFTSVDENNFTIENIAGNNLIVAVEIIDDNSLAPTVIKEYKLNGYF